MFQCLKSNLIISYLSISLGMPSKRKILSNLEQNFAKSGYWAKMFRDCLNKLFYRRQHIPSPESHFVKEHFPILIISCLFVCDVGWSQAFTLLNHVLMKGKCTVWMIFFPQNAMLYYKITLLCLSVDILHL